MKPGDLVRMRASIQPPRLYGIGLVMKTSGLRGYPDQKIFVKWPTMPDREPKANARYALELVSAAG